MNAHHPIGIFDSGSGGLYMLKRIQSVLPQYDYLYLGDHLHTPYGTKTFDEIFSHTLACVEHLGERGCPLIIIACNTSSAKALRNIQQKWLPQQTAVQRVLGIIIPTAEEVAQYTKTQHIGILATPATVTSQTFEIEIHKLHPHLRVFQQACPTWVDLVENAETYSPEQKREEIKIYIDALLAQSASIDTVVLGCTHYPMLLNDLRQHIPKRITIIEQGELIGKKLKHYLSLHSDIEVCLTKGNAPQYFTTGNPQAIQRSVRLFLDEDAHLKPVSLSRGRTSTSR